MDLEYRLKTWNSLVKSTQHWSNIQSQTKPSNTENKKQRFPDPTTASLNGQKKAKSLVEEAECHDIRSCAVRTRPPRCRWPSLSITCSSGERPPSPLPSWSERSFSSDYSTTGATRFSSIWTAGWVEVFVRLNSCFYLTLQIEGEAELMLSRLSCPLG